MSLHDFLVAHGCDRSGYNATGDQSDECNLVEEEKEIWCMKRPGMNKVSANWWGDLGTGKSEKGEDRGIEEVGLETGDGNNVCKGDGEQETTGELLRSRVETLESKS